MFTSENKKIWLYWHQGWNNAPELVRRCSATWIHRNADWEVRLLNKMDIKELITLPDCLFERQLPLPALSDIIRIHLLNDYGGVWADATTWCSRSLTSWINSAVEPNGFFAYDRTNSDRPLATWFLAVPEWSYLVSKWKSAVDAFWAAGVERQPDSDCPSTKNYFWFHSLFSDLIRNDKQFAELWSLRTSISADGPHYLQKRGLLRKYEDSDIMWIKENSPAVHKLTRRSSIPEDVSGTVLDALYNYG